MFSAIRSLFASKMLATETSNGSCPSFERMENFDLTAYWGRWYEAVRDKSTYFEIGADCVTAHYTDNGDNTTRVRNNQYSEKNGWTGGTAKAYDVGVDGGLFVSFNSEVPEPDQQPNYNVIHTDYENYTVVYDCEEFRARIYGCVC